MHEQLNVACPQQPVQSSYSQHDLNALVVALVLHAAVAPSTPQ
jgi:hypothetical protein